MTEKTFSALVRECDSLMAGPVVDANAERLVELIKDPTLYQYVFQSIRNPEWISPLKQRGFFMNPPSPVEDKEKSTISFPTWPEIQFLVRMAPIGPTEVVNVLLAMPATSNVSVHYDLARAALEVNADLASELAKKEIGWLDQQTRTVFGFHAFATLGKLISHLAKGGEKESALNLARSLLRILPDPEAGDKAKRGPFSLSPEPVTIIEYFDYEFVLKETVPDLVAVGGLGTLELLCDLLERVINFSSSNPDDNRTQDYSYIWRPSLASGQDRGLKDALVSATKKAVDHLAAANTNAVSEIVRVLERRSWSIFKRLSLYLLAAFPETEWGLIKDRLMDPRLFDEGEEWNTLASNHFGTLSPDEQTIYLDWVEKGPPGSFDTFANYRQFFGDDATEGDYQRYVKTWKRGRLKIVETALPNEWQTVYRGLVNELGESEGTTQASYVVRDADTGRSPKTIEDLRGMGITDLVRYLKDWQKEPGESPYALANNLTQAILSEPQRFATNALDFVDLDPFYLKNIISGIRQGIEAGWIIQWEPLIRMFAILIARMTGPDDSTSSDTAGLKREILSIASKGLNDGSAEIPFLLRDTTWGILKVLSSDPDPVPARESEYGASLDAASLSINTIRGEAIHRVIQYALWVRRALQKVEGFVSRGFQDMPEVKEVLDYHLEIENDPSLAIRAVYGQWLPWLVFLDKDWTAGSVSRIFPQDQALVNYREVAWTTYIIFCQPYDEAFEVLREEYEAAVERLGREITEKPSYGNPAQSLASHLMALYWRGKLQLDEPRLLGQFYRRAEEDLRGYALWFVGRSLKNTKEEIASTIRDRLQALWEWRLAENLLSPTRRAAELSAFGLWFTSKKFDRNWAVRQLNEVLKVTGNIEDDDDVVEQLATEAFEDRLMPIRCLKQLVTAAQDFWKVFTYQENARQIIADALKSGDETAQRVAEDVVERLMAQGHMTFRDLLAVGAA